ncbi:hypothetical protein [Arthrobacter wenxiniae]|uniref:Uncharacterized protein n=1 Tax=Arthrobacter wenxiniae TaxID=2713570 RepID=A0A7Y7IH69_9MICC|nr:hypothetical protein [Arthrobacter wenxiniae]NVM95450.1 hypothetical protein [Arthrobacter wenxiniae]
MARTRATDPGFPVLPPGITDQYSDSACYGPLTGQPAARTDRVAWMLGMNPFVVVADAIPYPEVPANGPSSQGVLESTSQGALRTPERKLPNGTRAA